MLRRRVGETILVGNDVEIEVIEISRSRVKLGIRAPCQISVVRKETVAVSRENRLASDLIATCGSDGVGEILQLLNRTGTPAVGEVPAQSNPVEDDSTKPGRRRYETPERYSRYRGSRENPHPA